VARHSEGFVQIDRKPQAGAKVASAALVGTMQVLRAGGVVPVGGHANAKRLVKHSPRLA
jgi:hypothetical protein